MELIESPKIGRKTPDDAIWEEINGPNLTPFDLSKPEGERQ